jgi:hypothetical protein
MRTRFDIRGKGSVPLNLPENDPRIFSHTRLINDAPASLDQRREQ